MNAKQLTPFFKRHYRAFAIIFVIFFVLIVLWFVSPIFLTKYANHRLAKISPDLQVHIERVYPQLIPPGINASDIDAQLQNKNVARIASISIATRWRDLLSFQPEFCILMQNPQLKLNSELVKFIQAETKPKTEAFAKEPSPSSRIIIREINIQNGDVNISDVSQNGDLPLKLRVTNLQTNILTSAQMNELSVIASSNFSEGGNLQLNLGINRDPKISGNMRLRLKDFQVRQLNTVFKKVANFDARNGLLDVYIEGNLRGDQVSGYIKPMLRDFDTVNWKKESKSKSFFYLLWKSLVEWSAKLLENPKTEKDAGIIPFKGEIKNLDFEGLTAFVSILKNAFGKPETPGFQRKPQGKT
jgi:hypothetical protein